MPAVVHRPVDLQGCRDVFHIMEVMMIESESTKRTHFWPKVCHEDRVNWVHDLPLTSAHFKLNIHKTYCSHSSSSSFFFTSQSKHRKYGVEEKAASLGVGYLGHPVTADGVSEKQRINRNTI